MFYNNSNDLVKKASSQSGRVQNSNETRKMMLNQITSINDEVLNTNVTHKRPEDSLSIGTIFQNMIQTMINKVTSTKEGMEGVEGGLSNSATGEGGGKFNEYQGLKAIADQQQKYTNQEVEHIERVKSIVKLIEINNNDQRQRWAEVTDSEGITKYGYITKDGIFQIWNYPSSISSNPTNWLETDKMVNNTNVLQCPASSNLSIQKIKIAGTWGDLKPFSFAYADNDGAKTTPLFMIINTGVKDPNNTPNRSGLFSCNNENKNIFVTQKPSADFQFTNQGVDTHQIGCYTIPNNVYEKDFENRGFKFQEDLFEATISQCKRRAEDLGSSYFFISAPEKGSPPNRGGCWIYMRAGKPNISGILNFNSDASKCHRVNHPEDGEDKFMKRYNTSDVKRLYGKETSYYDRSVALYCLKTGGPTGVDNSDQNGRGKIGEIANVDYNGNRRDYPSSALSFMKSTKENPVSYINLGGYDTRSVEDSYSLTQITPGKANSAGNLLYRATSNEWSPSEWWRLCSDKGPTYTRVILSDGRELGSYNSKSWTYNGGWYWIHDSESFVYDGKNKYPGSNSIWGNGMYTHLATDNRYFPYFAGYDMLIWGNTLYMIGGAMHSMDNGDGPFGTRRHQWRWDSYSMQDLETYAVDPNSFPRTNPPDYVRKIRTLAVGQSIPASFEKCRELCDGDDKCGGYVYTEGSVGTQGKCELKDKSKMYPIGVRTLDTTKQLIMKVPKINSTISDEGCKNNNGKYEQVDTTQYAHYPYTGPMSGSSLCSIEKIVNKKGSLNPQEPKSMYKSVDTIFADTQSIINIFEDQLQSKKGATTSMNSPDDGQEGMTNFNYTDTMIGVQKDLEKISNAEYQRERIIAMTDETNKQLISESYKFILWSILAILVVLALIKLKEMFGQDDVDNDSNAADSAGGGFLATLLGLFSIGKADTSDIADRTDDIKSEFVSAGNNIMQATDQLSTNITEGADNLISSVNDAASTAVEGAKNMADKVSETATDAVNKVGDAVSSPGDNNATTPATGGKKRKHKK